ncbi:MAG: carbohydrate ABC transporter permease [Clostridia bacterium]|nr:carbohydrate ABC transporter permease [Clostridia bacterium]
MKKITACVLVVLLLTFALPMLMLFAASFFQGDLISFLKGETVFLQASWQRYTIMFDNEELLIQLMNSIKIALSTLILQLPLSVLGGLFLARSSIKGVGLIRVLLLLLLLLPFQSIMVPVFKMSRWLNLYDTQLAVILMQAFSPLGPLIAWLLIRAIPGEHWEAALLDCKSQLTIFCRAIMPQLLPGLAVLTLLCFAEAWNLVELPLILLPDTELRPASLMLNDIRSGSNQYAEAVLYALPILLLYGITGITLKKEDISIV